MSKEANRRGMLRKIERIGRKEYNRYHNHNYSVKKRILKGRTHGYCQICRKLFPRELLSVDHIIQVMNGGTHDNSNLQLACRPCQEKKDVEALQLKQKEKGLIKNPDLLKRLSTLTAPQS